MESSGRDLVDTLGKLVQLALGVRPEVDVGDEETTAIEICLLKI